MHLKVCKFGCDRLVIYDFLFEEPCALSALYRTVLEGFSVKRLHHIPQSFAKFAVCLVSIGSLITGPVLEEKFTYSALFRFSVVSVLPLGRLILSFFQES